MYDNIEKLAHELVSKGYSPDKIVIKLVDTKNNIRNSISGAESFEDVAVILNAYSKLMSMLNVNNTK